MPTLPPSAWTKRKIQRLSIEVASAQAIEAATNNASPNSSDGLRPYRSEIGPQIACPSAKTDEISRERSLHGGRVGRERARQRRERRQIHVGRQRTERRERAEDHDQAKAGNRLGHRDLEEKAAARGNRHYSRAASAQGHPK